MMDELSDYTSNVIEFRPSVPLGKSNKHIDSCIGTDPLPPVHNVSVATNTSRAIATQTELASSVSGNGVDVRVDERALASWLRRIYPQVEAELLGGPTPMPDSYIRYIQSNCGEVPHIQTYQKLTIEAVENSQALATWLSVHTNNAPILVVSACAPHDDWCEHINQEFKVFMPKRVKSGNFVVFTAVKSVPLKACLKCLRTNPFNKSIFAGSMLDGDLYIWQYEHLAGSGQVIVHELFKCTSSHEYALDMDWCGEQRLLTCHANGWIIDWHMAGNEMMKIAEYHLSGINREVKELTCILSLSLNDFVVGATDGCVFHCWRTTAGMAMQKETQLEIVPLTRHTLMISTLLKRRLAGYVVVISCDLGGQVYYHNLRHEHDDDETAQIVVKIPLPFKNAIACSQDGTTIYCPGIDGSLECYHTENGLHTIVKGGLRGKGNMIRCSENGRWLITGLYANEFQIFYIEE